MELQNRRENNQSDRNENNQSDRNENNQSDRNENNQSDRNENNLSTQTISNNTNNNSSTSRSFLNSRAIEDLSPKEQARKFIEKFKSQYGEIHPNFLQNSFETSCSEAKKSAKFLFVYIHCETHDSTKYFCEKVLATDHVKSFLDSNFICWGGNVFSNQGRTTSEKLSICTYPAIAILCQNNRGTMTRVDLIEGHISSDDLISRLSTSLENHSSSLNELHQQQILRERDRNLREEQDLEFQRSLQQDREREEKRREEERMKKEEEERKKKEEEKKENIREEKLKSVGKEPDSGPNIVQLSIRLTNGSKQMRRFSIDSQIKNLLDFVDYHQLGLPNSPDEYEVATHFPKVIYSDPLKTFREAGLTENQQIFVEEKF